MENLPIEVVGNILSQLGSARDVMVASATCKKWRDACTRHLRVLSFDSSDWAGYRALTIDSCTCLEIIITQTIFQTSSLQSLSIIMDGISDEFLAAPVIAWLMYTRETLRSLIYTVPTTPTFNILEKLGRQKLEVLELAHNSIIGVEPSYQRFPSLVSLSLSNVSISALDLNLLLTACPKIEDLVLVRLDIHMSDTHATLELCSPTLKSILIQTTSSLDKFILEADTLETFHLKDSSLEQFELIGKGTLKNIIIDDVSFIHLDIGETDNLEIVDLSRFTLPWPKFHQLISRSSKLRKLRLWGMVFDDEDEIVNLETVAMCFPKLKHFALSCDMRDGLLHYGLQGSAQLENVTVLELGWVVIGEHFCHWVEGVLDRCPNVKKLVVHGFVFDIKTQEECQMLANFTSDIVRLMRRYMHLDVQFKYTNEISGLSH
ncbi:F-box/LRR-repeat protein [Zostera marina]|uniref:F-box/LRR-repeat protein n=1 Tax=Zostera marina TaxID=29655 RepID=A0A0K9PCV3_ZOSMR|nr:F-box/LRR-repeat protein [Zostera marina]